MAASPQNRSAHLGMRADARPRPQDGILDPRPLFDEAVRPYDGIHDLGSRLHRATRIHDREPINARGLIESFASRRAHRGIGPHLAGQHIEIRLR